MTPAERQRIEAIEKARKKREDEELLLLLLLLDDEIDIAIQVSAASRYVLGSPASMRTVAASIRHGLLTRGVPVLAEGMAGAHIDGVGIYGGPGAAADAQRDIEKLIRQYAPVATQTATAMADAIETALDLYVATPDRPTNLIKDALKLAGYTVDSPRALKIGIERNVVSAGNAGLLAGGIGSIRYVPGVRRRPPGLRHVSVLDGATTAICRSRDGLTLPITDPYWLVNWPSLHARCRSIIAFLSDDYDVSDWRPGIPPDPGYGVAPQSVVDAIAGYAQN